MKPSCGNQVRSRLMLFVLALFAAMVLPSLAQDFTANSPIKPASAELFDQQLETGEFAPALATSQKLPSAEQQIALKRLSAAQAQQGQYRGAIETAVSLSDDNSRAKQLADIGKQQRERRQHGQGGTEADFDSLIELITNTIEPPTWKQNGGVGDLFGFESGVYCDPQGTLHKRTEVDPTRELNRLRELAREPGQPGTVRTRSPLRKVSLRRLELAVQRALALGETLPDDVRYLAGLQRIQYVLVYPNDRDIVIAGPADDWQTDQMGRPLGVTSQAPVLHLDDLVSVLRHMLSRPGAVFGCSITPTKERLAATQEFLNQTTQKPLKPGERDAWVKQLREQLGQQRIDINGLDPQSRAALILVEADYHMKLVGVGLEPAIPGVENYLDSIKVAPGQPVPPLDVLRWWFAMRYDSIRCSADKLAFEFRGQGVQLLCENELLARDGERQHTGQASDLNQVFTNSFTKHYGQLSLKYPVYAELRNLFDIALLGAVLQTYDLPQQTQWQMCCFGPQGSYHTKQQVAPKWVDSIMRSRMVNQKQILVGVSGGVRADAWSLVKESALEVDSSKRMSNGHEYQNRTRPMDQLHWWWD